MPVDRTSGDFGSKLREARERRGISLRQIANATKIAVGVLEALERNDISRLPGGIFGRAFVRSYAVEVGLDPEQTIQEFIAQFPHESVTVGHPTSARVEDIEGLESDRRSASTFLRLLMFSVPIAALVVWLTASGRLSPRDGARQRTVPSQSAPAPAASDPSLAAPPAREVPSPAPTAPPTDDRITVAVSASRPCRVATVADGRKRERILQPGERTVMEVRRSLVMTVDDPEAITMTINGASAKPLGPPGEAVTARITPGNFTSFLAAR